MSQTWDQASIQEYIDEEREESLTLDYKAAGSLAKSEGKKAEITKDVSAMANSTGGIILYGVAEHTDPAKRHLAEKIDPIDRRQFPKEWLEHVISNIRPHIDGLIIHPVSISNSSNGVVYVVEIPQGNTAHQATDKRYYKRFNFESVPMDDYEIRDIMNRAQHPMIKLDFRIKIIEGVYYEQFRNSSSINTECELLVCANNIGQVYAQYVNVVIGIPAILEYKWVEDEDIDDSDIPAIRIWQRTNTVRDVVDTQHAISGGSINKYGPSRFAPILPGLSHDWQFDLNPKFDAIEKENLEIEWSVYADNAPASHGKVFVRDIEVIEKRVT